MRSWPIGIILSLVPSLLLSQVKTPFLPCGSPQGEREANQTMACFEKKLIKELFNGKQPPRSREGELRSFTIKPTEDGQPFDLPDDFFEQLRKPVRIYIDSNVSLKYKGKIYGPSRRAWSLTLPKNLNKEKSFIIDSPF